MRRDVVHHLQGAYGMGEWRACSVTGFRRSSHRYRTRRDPQIELRLRPRDLAAARVRYGYRRLHVLLRREGWPVNHMAESRARRGKDRGADGHSGIGARGTAW